MRDQAIGDEPPRSQEMGECGHVPTFGPANIPIGIISPVFFISRVIAPWAIGTAQAEIEFLLVVDLTRYIQADRTNSDHHSTIPREFTRERQRFVAPRV